MKKLFVLIVLIACCSQAHAATVGPAQCSLVNVDRVCTKEVTCAGGPCDVTLDFGVNATCSPSTTGNPVTLTASTVLGSGAASCEWTVADPGTEIIVVTIDGADGLPVELESFSVE